MSHISKDYLYKDFQWKIIFKVLSESAQIIESSNKISEIDEKEVNNILSKKYMKGEHLHLLKNMFNVSLLHNIEYKNKTQKITDTIPQIPYLNNKIIDVLNNLKFASSTESTEGYALLSNFKSINNMIIIKTTRNKEHDLNILYEYFIGTIGLNKLRNLTPNFSYTLGIFKCSPLPIDQNKNIVQKNFCVDNIKDHRFYVVYEKIIGESFGSFIRNMNTNPNSIIGFISYIIQIALSLYIAQEEINFVHYDLHTENVILRPLEKEDNYKIKYTIDNKIYTIKTNAIATIIDYGFSHFTYEGAPFGVVQFTHLGVLPTRTNRGYDFYKLIMFAFAETMNYNKIINGKVIYGKAFTEVSWLLDFFSDKEDPYDIYNSYKSGDYKRLTEAFKKGQDNYYSILPIHKKLYNLDLLSFIEWFLKLNQNIITTEYVDYNKMDTFIVDKYIAKIDNKKIFKNIDMNESLDKCNLLNNNKYNSFIVNKYIIEELSNIVKNFKIKDKDKIKDKIKLLDNKNNKNKNKYTKIDNELINFYDININKTIKQLNYNKYNNDVYNISNSRDISNLSNETNIISKFIELYINYKIFVNYSKRSVKIPLNLTYEELYLKFKRVINSYNCKKSEYIHTSLNNFLITINNVIYNFKTSTFISPSNWNLTDDFINSLGNIQYVFNDLYMYYPQLTYAYKTIETFIFELIDQLNKVRKRVIYIPPSSDKQFIMAYTCDSEILMNLIFKYIRQGVSLDFVKLYMDMAINDRKTDESIYKELFKLITKDNIIVNLDFLKNVKLDINNNFTCLNIGLDISIKEILNLNEENIQYYNSESDDLSGKILKTFKNRLPYQDQYFSFITVINYIQIVRNIVQLVLELNRIIKPKGFVLIRENDINHICTKIYSDIQYMLERKEHKKEHKSYYTTYNDLNNYMTHGFMIITEKYIKDNKINPTNSFYVLYQKL